MELKKTSFVMACNSFFGRKHNQTLMEFNQELKGLTLKDRQDFVAWFREAGLEIIDVPPVAATA